MSRPRIVITGMGIISPLGVSVAENLESLRKARSGISKANFLSSKYANELLFGEVTLSNEDLRLKLNDNTPGVTRTMLLTHYAFKDAIADAGLGPDQVSDQKTAFIGADTVGGMCLTDEMYMDANLKSSGSPYLTSYDFASVNVHIQKRYHLKGIVNTINTACSSSANAIMFGARLISRGVAHRAIVGGSDSLAKFTVNGFNSLGILSDSPCAPFDLNRKGLNLGEGAAFFVLEKYEDAKDKRNYAELTGFGNTNDAYHPSSLSPEGEGPYLAMKTAIESANIKPEDVGYINAHGTGTENNDLVESIAMKRLFGKVPFFSSTKSGTGHTLGAAGAIEAVYSILNLYYGELFPSLNFKDPIPETGLIPVHENKKMDLQHVLSNSFGFGGNCSSLVFSKSK
jgi:3-oxoacyl-(acyl-carrier-protein) synthase